MEPGFPLSNVGDVRAEMKSVEAQAIQLICAEYGKVAESCTYMTECSQNVALKNRGSVVHHQ